MKVKYIEFYMEDVSSVVSSPFLVRFDLLIDGERVEGVGVWLTYFCWRGNYGHDTLKVIILNGGMSDSPRCETNTMTRCPLHPPSSAAACILRQIILPCASVPVLIFDPSFLFSFSVGIPNVRWYGIEGDYSKFHLQMVSFPYRSCQRCMN